MSIKYFCDACERQLGGPDIGRSIVGQRYRPTRYMNQRNFAAEVSVSVGGTWNAGHLCLECLKKILVLPDCELTERDAAPSPSPQERT